MAVRSKPIDYAAVSEATFCACGCPIDVAFSEGGTTRVIPFLLQAKRAQDRSIKSFPTCPFCYRSNEFPTGKELGMELSAKTTARVLAEGLRAEGIIGAGCTWKP